MGIIYIFFYNKINFFFNINIKLDTNLINLYKNKNKKTKKQIIK